MKTSQAGIDLIKRFEGLRLHAYLCAAGVPTIGYGHTRGVKLGQRCTDAEAEAWLVEDLEESERHVARLGLVLTPNEHAALVSLAFNVGHTAVDPSRSTLARLLRQGDKQGAAAQFLVWCKATDPKTGEKVTLDGLLKRRRAERELFERPA